MSKHQHLGSSASGLTFNHRIQACFGLPGLIRLCSCAFSKALGQEENNAFTLSTQVRFRRQQWEGQGQGSWVAGSTQAAPVAPLKALAVRWPECKWEDCT